jgi:hypothetical protein
VGKAVLLKEFLKDEILDIWDAGILTGNLHPYFQTNHKALSL